MERFEDGQVIYVSMNGGQRVPWVKRSLEAALEDMSRKPSGILSGSADIPVYSVYTPNPSDECAAEITHEVTKDALICDRARIMCHERNCGLIATLGYMGPGSVAFFPRVELSTIEALSKLCPRWQNLTE